MEILFQLVDIFLHLDKHLAEIIMNYQTWTYLILFLVIFCETGFVVTPFLPGDSLLFAAGTLCAMNGSPLNVYVLMALLITAAILGDTVNYWTGNFVGPKVFHYEKNRFFKKEHLIKTHNFYEKHGGKTIIFARFIPIIRTFAPFVAGIGSMTYVRFISYNIFGGIAWVSSFLLAGFYFGNIPMVKRNFTMVIMAIIIISVIPVAIEFIKNFRAKSKPA